MKRGLLTAWVVVCLLAAVVPIHSASAELHPAYHDRAKQATVMISFIVRALEGGVEVERLFWPTGSATIVERDGLLLSNLHVVDSGPALAEIDRLNADYAGRNHPRVLELEPDLLLVSLTRDNDQLEPGYTARVGATDPALDLAVLHIVGNADGVPLNAELDLPYLPRGDSDGLTDDAELHLYGYPEDATGIRWTDGRISGFERADWIDLAATASAGFSGGAAVDVNGNLVAIPTEMTDTELGVARVLLRPINLATTLLESKFIEPESAAPIFGPLSSTVAIVPELVSDAPGASLSVEVPSNRDLLATFEIVNPEFAQFPTLWNLTILVQENSPVSTPCIYVLANVGIVLFGGGAVPTEENTTLDVARAANFMVRTGAVNELGIRLLDGASWIRVNGEEIGPFVCPPWSGSGRLILGASWDFETSPGSVAINNLTVWDMGARPAPGPNA
jgi:S1-C subfamily serine protease